MEEICKEIVDKLTNKDKTISFMESCTGGFLANCITNIFGASKVIKVSLVTYCNEYKEKFGVDKNIINTYTVYSIETAKEMARNVANFAKSSIGVGITGILDNTKEQENKVYYAIYNSDTNKYITKEINIEAKNKRCAMKKEIANDVLNSILEELNGICEF